MKGGGWCHPEAEPSCGFVDESFGPAHALRTVWTARGQRARRALPTACPHSRASRPQLHRTDNNFFHKWFVPPEPMRSIQSSRSARMHPKPLLTSDASRPIIRSSRKRHPASTSIVNRPISPSLSHWTTGHRDVGVCDARGRGSGFDHRIGMEYSTAQDARKEWVKTGRPGKL